MNLNQELKRKLAHYLLPNSTLIVGVSGGADSVYLLLSLISFAEHSQNKLIVAHINHKLRGQDSDDDEKFVKKLCRQNHLTFVSTKMPPIKAGNLEEEARQFRYIFFEKLRKKYDATLILTAHHQDDSIETALFNLIRGAFIDGLKGMEEFSEDRFLLRPMLHLGKSEILASLKKEQIPFCVDITNADNRFSRNLLRNVIIPEMEKINPRFKRTFAGNLTLINQVSDFLNTYCTTWLQKNRSRFGYSLEKLLREPEIVQGQILAIIYRKTHSGPANFNRQHLHQIISTLKLNKSGVKKEFGTGYNIVVKKDPLNSARYFNIVEIKQNI